uniref:PH domain-containing protein n=1 Tax=Amphiprion ocellaris TaxID=80972 RepID=A0AAQ5X686_AMPOC
MLVHQDAALHSEPRSRAGRPAAFGSVTAEQSGAGGNMSGEKSSGPCGRFQANIFNKSKCQNCFKSRELHLLTDRDMEQAKPIYGGWLCLAPEGTDFENPMQRSRKWQRRFFILYEDGSLSFALDELPSTLPQGTLNMNLCTDIADAEPRTGQKNALCIVTPEQEIFIRGENKEIINGWSEQLTGFLRTNKQNQKKKRKVDPVANQVEKQQPAELAYVVMLVFEVCLELCKYPRKQVVYIILYYSAIDHIYYSKARTVKSIFLLFFFYTFLQRFILTTKLCICLSSLQPDLLNFKKGWMVKLDEKEQWKKYWFVLSTDSLRYYKDSIAEEASDLEGEIDLTKCYNVSEYQVQRNYGFQIHVRLDKLLMFIFTIGFRPDFFPFFSVPGHQPEVLPKPDVTQDSPSSDVPTDRDSHHKPKSVMERRREGRYNTFDWAEFRPQSRPPVARDPQRTTSPCSLELSDLERRKKREERRRRYENMLGISLGWEENGEKMVDGGVRALSPKSQQRVEEEIEECWKEVEKTVFRLDRTVPMFNEARDAMETEKLLHSYRNRVEDLKAQLAESERCKLKLEAQLSAAGFYQRQVCKVYCLATCERGFTCMEESHLKVVEELQRRHQQELERLLVERDRLLEEESAATATAIEAIKNAHRLELQREVERRCQSENGNANTHLDDICRQHSEELASFQRELEVLSQQFSLKCLENGHLVQALDAERKALCQCQQENQDLRTRNQELSGHLAAEITRLCSLAKQDDLPLGQGMDVYEMEITLRVKESEVQCLKQEITSLKDELQSAQKDKRNATKKYKDMYTELSIVRAKAEREAEELRENLRLAHQALGQTSPSRFIDVVLVFCEGAAEIIQVVGQFKV